MRLIDATLLKKQFIHSEKAYLSIEEICKWIDEATTERKIGHWISNGKNGAGIINPGRHCSVCNKVVEFSENYCPRCGSEMRCRKCD